MDMWFLTKDGTLVKVTKEEQKQAAADYLVARVREANGL